MQTNFKVNLMDLDSPTQPWLASAVVAMMLLGVESCNQRGLCVIYMFAQVFSCILCFFMKFLRLRNNQCGIRVFGRCPGAL